jgi:hypothetical protein
MAKIIIDYEQIKLIPAFLLPALEAIYQHAINEDINR